MRQCECGRELERYQHYCSECAYIRRQITRDKCMSDPARYSKHKKTYAAWKRKTYKTRSEWREIARAI